MLAEILNRLHTGSTAEIYSILNRSIYITDIPNKVDALLFHTGFEFRSHKGKFFYVYYDLISASVIRVPESTNPLYGKIPQLLGLLCPVKGGDYISNFQTELITSLALEEPNESEESTEVKGFKGIEEYTVAEILEPNKLQVKNKSVALKSGDSEQKKLHENFTISRDGQIENRFSLYKTFRDVVFTNSFSFSKYDPTLYSQEERQSLEDWYREEFGEQANDAWWNSH